MRMTQTKTVSLSLQTMHVPPLHSHTRNKQSHWNIQTPHFMWPKSEIGMERIEEEQLQEISKTFTKSMNHFHQRKRRQQRRENGKHKTNHYLNLKATQYKCSRLDLWHIVTWYLRFASTQHTRLFCLWKEEKKKAWIDCIQLCFLLLQIYRSICLIVCDSYGHFQSTNNESREMDFTQLLGGHTCSACQCRHSTTSVEWISIAW